MTENDASSRRWLAIGCVLAPVLTGLAVASLGAADWLVAVAAIAVALIALRALLTRCVSPLLALGDQRALQAIQARDAAGTAHAEQALLGVVLERIDEPILATDEQGCVIYTNPACSRQLTPAIDVAARPPFDEIFRDSSLIDLERACRSRPSDPLGSIWATLPTPKGGEVRWRVRASSVPGAASAPAGALVIFRDETALTAAVRARADFVANASHELRTPLAAIQGAVATVRSVLRDDPVAAARFIDMIDANAERLAAIARRLLDLSRLESGVAPLRCEPFDPAKLEKSLDALFAPARQATRVNLRIDMDDSLTGFPIDPWRLSLILFNLIDNAIKFSKVGCDVRLSARRQGERCVFTVTDKGAGIRLADQQRVFERFYQADESRSGIDRAGAGIGLAVVKHAVRELKGEIRLESVYGEGTTVRVELPPAPASAPAPGSHSDLSVQSSSDSLRTIS